jgi:hypothetical protein
MLTHNHNAPFLPGHKFNDPYKTSFHKNQVFHYPNKTCLGNLILTLEKPEFKKEKIDPYTISSLSTLTSFYTSDRLKNRDTELNQSYPRILPQWIKHDKNVTSLFTLGP